MESKLNLIWIDVNYDNKENTSYLKEFKKIKTSKIKCFKDNDEAIKYIKAIKFEKQILLLVDHYILNLLKNLKKKSKIFILSLK